MVHIIVVKKENAKLTLECWTKIPLIRIELKLKKKKKVTLSGPYLGKLFQFPKKYMEHGHQLLKGVIKFYEMWIFEICLSVIRNMSLV